MPGINLYMIKLIVNKILEIFYLLSCRMRIVCYVEILTIKFEVLKEKTMQSIHGVFSRRNL